MRRDAVMVPLPVAAAAHGALRAAVMLVDQRGETGKDADTVRAAERDLRAIIAGQTGNPPPEITGG